MIGIRNFSTDCECQYIMAIVTLFMQWKTRFLASKLRTKLNSDQKNFGKCQKFDDIITGVAELDPIFHEHHLNLNLVTHSATAVPQQCRSNVIFWSLTHWQLKSHQQAIVISSGTVELKIGNAALCPFSFSVNVMYSQNSIYRASIGHVFLFTGVYSFPPNTGIMSKAILILILFAASLHIPCYFAFHREARLIKVWLHFKLYNIQATQTMWNDKNRFLENEVVYWLIHNI